MAAEMTNAQIWAQANSDPNFAINFIIDNNPAAVESNLSGQGIYLPDNPSNAQIRGEINQLMEQIKTGVDNTDLISNDILMVPYIDTNPNYTGGMMSNPDFTQALDNLRTTNPNASSGVFVGILNGITNAVSGIIQGIQAQNIQEMQNEALMAQLQYDRDRFESGKVFGIPMVVVLAMIGLIGFMAYLAYNKK